MFETVQKQMATIRAVAQVIGLLVSSFSAVELGKLHYREIEKEKIVALKDQKGNFDAVMHITDTMKTELKWWIDNIHCQFRKIRRDNPQVCFSTDSSTEGWGCVMGNTKFGGRWTDSEKQYHINALELLAIFFALKAFEPLVQGKYVKVLTDSTTAMSYMNNFGGVKSHDCNKISKDIWQWCLEHDVWVTCCHIPGVENTADEPSRHFKDYIEWELDQGVFHRLCDRWEIPTIDLFASRLNKKVSVFCSWKPDPEASYIDAFSMDWRMFSLCYVFCPFP